MRLFIALSASPEFLSAYSSLQNKLRGTRGVQEFLAPEDLHVTVSFLGSVADGELGHFQFLTEWAGRLKPVDMSAGNVETFGSPARGVWALCQAPPALHDWQAELTQCLLAEGFKPDLKTYKPHITISRQKQLPSFSDTLAPPIFFTAEQLHVYKTRETKEPFRYERLQSFRLGKK